MICINPILKSPILAAIAAGTCVMLYFYLMIYSPKLTPAVMYSITTACFVYYMMGGRVLCDEPIVPETTSKTDLPLLAPQTTAKVTGVKCRTSSKVNNIPSPPGCTETEPESESVFGQAE
jgi:hypothetical protein